jgi:hypothetical protein
MRYHSTTGGPRLEACPDLEAQGRLSDISGLDGLISEQHRAAMASMLARAELLRQAAMMERRAQRGAKSEGAKIPPD